MSWHFILLVAVVLFVAGAIYGFLRRRYKWTATDTAASRVRSSQASYGHRVAVALDIFLNVVANGKEDETISARAGRWAHKAHPGPWYYRWPARVLTAFLNAIQVDHGEQAMSGDLERASEIVTLETAALQEPSFDKVAK
jgi:hypothetical protein